MKTTIDTRVCTQPTCHAQFRSRGLRPPCPGCGHTLTLVLSSVTTNDPGAIWTTTPDPYPVRTH